MSSREENELLIQELLEGSISKEDFARIEQLLLTDRELRRDYFALMCTDQMLVDNFDMPGPLAIEPRQLGNASLKIAPEKSRRWAWISGIAAALVVSAISVFTFYPRPVPIVTVVGSADSYFLIDGITVNEAVLAKGQRLEVLDGVVEVRINDATQACIDGPAQVTLAENGQDLDLRRGKVFFTVGDHAREFQVRVAGATVRNSGTQFGIRASEGGSCDVHVVAGSIEIDRGNSQGKWNLKSGEAVSWLNRGATRVAALDVAEFRKALPQETTVFEDDFSEPKETLLEGKQPDVGQPWRIQKERQATTVGGGRLDTSGGSRNLLGPFLKEPFPDNRQVVLLSFSTRQPSWIWDKQTRLGGIEKIALQAEDGRVICSVQARAAEGHRWRLRDEITGLESDLTGISALQESELTLRYDALGGKITLHAGTSTQAEIVAEIPASVRAVPIALVIWNDEGGDLAINRLSVRTVNYPSTGGL
jgi:ferric-dicitrate binding protein FerR (iron transport regulator)